MAAITDLTAAEAVAAVRRGDLDAGELFAAYRDRAAADELNAFLWVADGPPQDGAAGRPLAGVPLGVKDLFCTKDVPSQAGSRILEGYRPPYTATVVERLADAGAPLLGKLNQDEFAMGSSNENSAFGPVRNPWDRGRVPGGSSGGSAAAVAAGIAPWALGDGHGRLDPPAGRAVRDRRPQADLRLGQPLRDDRLRLLAGPGRPADPRRHRRGAALRAHGRPRPLRLDLAGLPGGGRACRPPSGWTACASASRRSSPARASSPACWRPSRRRSTRPGRSARRSTASRCRTPTTA